MQKAASWIYNYILFFLPKDGSHPWDYVAHFIVSFAGVGILFLMFLFLLKPLGVHPKIALYVGAGIMLAIGIAKEISDKNLGKTDMAGDILSDILGIIAAMIVILLITRLLTNG